MVHASLGMLRVVKHDVLLTAEGSEAFPHVSEIRPSAETYSPRKSPKQRRFKPPTLESLRPSYIRQHLSPYIDITAFRLIFPSLPSAVPGDYPTVIVLYNSRCMTKPKYLVDVQPAEMNTCTMYTVDAHLVLKGGAHLRVDSPVRHLKS